MLPVEWDIRTWIENNGQFNPSELWLTGQFFYKYLREELDFPFRKVKNAQHYKSECLTLMNGRESWFHLLSFPSGETLQKFQAEMLESANNLK